MGKHLHEVMGWSGPLTHRQYRAWQAWLDLDLDRPGKTDHYLMQIACAVTRSNAKHPESVKLEDFRLRFKQQRAPAAQLTPAQRAAASKARWAGILGMGGTKEKE